MAAFAVVHMAGFAGVEVSRRIAIDLTIDVAVLEIGVGVAIHAAVVVGGRNVIDTGPGLQQSGERVLVLCDAAIGNHTNGLIAAVDHDNAGHLREIGRSGDAGRDPAIAVIFEIARKRKPLDRRVELELSIGIRCEVNAQGICFSGVKGSAILRHVKRHCARIRTGERIGQIGNLDDAVLVELVIGCLMFVSGAAVTGRAGLEGESMADHCGRTGGAGRTSRASRAGGASRTGRTSRTDWTSRSNLTCGTGRSSAAGNDGCGQEQDCYDGQS